MNGSDPHYLATRAFVFSICLLAATNASAESPDFAHDVAPILEQHCLRCHSESSRKGDVSLATFADLKANEYVVPGDPDGSYLWELITATADQPAAMPKEAPPLSVEQLEVVRRWIATGADWPDDAVLRVKSKADQKWWSLQPLAKVSPPVLRDPPALWDRNPIDRFVAAKLQDQGLAPRPAADRRTLIRRLTFDLHGLPPTPEAVDAFVNDLAPQAYERLVDQLLESPHYGERMARHWLDIAHYADTHGFERDRRRDHAWRYRDYVIRSFNDDKPYDRFLQEQIAGDVLWPEDVQAQFATGFLAAGPWDFVGQVETKSDTLRRAARALDLDDMATQVMTSTMAMTINCARCHDHKLDPISQREYYQLIAVFAGLKRGDRDVSRAALEKYEAEKSRLTSELNTIDFEIGKLEGTGLNLADVVGGGNGYGTGTYRHGIDARTAKVQTRDFGALGNVVANRFVTSAFEFVDGVFIPNGEDGRAEIVVSSTGTTISGIPSTSAAAWDMIRNGPVASQHSPSLNEIDFTRPPHSLLGLHANAGITFDLQSIRRMTDLRGMRFVAKLGYFGAVGAYQADARVFVDGRKAAEFRRLQRADGLQAIDINLSPASRFLTLVSTDGGNGYSHDQIGFGDPQLISTDESDRSSGDQKQLATLRALRRQTVDRLAALGAPPKYFGVVSSNPVPDVHVLTRGDPESPLGEPLAPAALTSVAMLEPALGTTASTDGERRVALAHWITDHRNPLTSRVIVNRLWQWHFGRGIVGTSSDFGFGGDQPSHPDLLDWLAAELWRRGGSLKQIHRLILNSQTYRMSSRLPDVERSDSGSDPPLATKVDADNRLLWRQNARRIEAEAIRDAVLFVSGKLNRERGGPGFEDFVYRDAYAPIYSYVTADKPNLWKRSIYRFIVRTTPSPFLTTFDCPDPANLTPRRLTTTTPLQSLTLYNNEFILKQSQYFAERLELEAGTDTQDQIQRAFALALARSATDEEVRWAEELVEDYGLFALCRSLFNANEFVYVD